MLINLKQIKGRGIKYYMFNIHLDFKSYNCDACKTTYTEEYSSCPNCGVVDSDFEEPYSFRRKKVIAEIIETIEKYDNEIKDIRKKIVGNSNIKISYNEFEFFVHVLTQFEKLHNMCEYDSLDLTVNSLESSKTFNKIGNLGLFFDDLCVLYKHIIIANTPLEYNNLYRRVVDAITNYLKSMKLFIKCIYSNSLENAKENQKKAQDYLDNATKSIEVISRLTTYYQVNAHINNKQVINFTNISNYIFYFGDSNAIHFSERVKEIESKTYDYFKELLKFDFDYYKNKNVIFSMIPLFMVALISFDETRFNRKVKVLVELFEKAADRNFNIFLSSIYQCKEKYDFSQSKIYEIAQKDLLFINACQPNDTLFISGSIDTYKSLCEGVYRDLTSIIIFALKIVRDDNIDIDKILNEMNFADKMELIGSQSKLKIQNLTHGVNSIIRHSVAHDDFTINNNEKNIEFRNKNKDGDKKTLVLSYDDFLLEKSYLMETLFSINCAILIFACNHYEKLSYFIETVDNEEALKEINGGVINFSVLGIINIETQIEKKTAHIRAKTLRTQHENKTLLESAFSCLPIYVHFLNETIEYVVFELYNETETFIGRIKYNHQFFEKYYSNKENIRISQFDLLLVSLTTVYEYSDNNGMLEKESAGDEKGLVFIKSVLIIVFNSLQSYTESIKLLIDKQQYEALKEEIVYIQHITNIYQYHLFDLQYIKFLKKLLLDLQYIIEPNKLLQKENKTKLSEIFYKFSEIFGSYSKNNEEQVLTNISNCYRPIIKVGRNDKCPCGSDRKYKQCCGI